MGYRIHVGCFHGIGVLHPCEMLLPYCKPRRVCDGRGDLRGQAQSESPADNMWVCLCERNFKAVNSPPKAKGLAPTRCVGSHLL